jgi:hypothetical protein
VDPGRYRRQEWYWNTGLDAVSNSGRWRGDSQASKPIRSYFFVDYVKIGANGGSGDNSRERSNGKCKGVKP